VAEPEPSEQDYLRQIELLARDVVDAAPGEALRHALTELGHALRYQHFEGDGCIERDRPLLRLGGAALITPDQNGYRTGCARLGVDARDEGWALWCTWDHKARAHTLVTTALATTQGLLENWAQGRDVHPAWPLRSQVRSVVRHWVGPMVDLGDLCAGEPAWDLAGAWLLLPDGAIDRFYRGYAPAADAATRRRARGLRARKVPGLPAHRRQRRVHGRPGGKATWGPPAAAALHRLAATRARRSSLR